MRLGYEFDELHERSISAIVVRRPPPKNLHLPHPFRYTPSAMLSISHAATGAFLAAKLQNPVLYIPATLASHYLEDWILHWDVGTGLSNGSRKRASAFIMELLDLALAVVLIYWMFRDFSNALQPHIALGAFMGLLPDFIEAPRNFLKWNPWFLKPFNDFHHSLHHSTPNILLGVAPQVLLIAILWAVK